MGHWDIRDWEIRAFGDWGIGIGYLRPGGQQQGRRSRDCVWGHRVRPCNTIWPARNRAFLCWTSTCHVRQLLRTTYLDEDIRTIILKRYSGPIPLRKFLPQMFTYFIQPDAQDEQHSSSSGSHCPQQRASRQAGYYAQSSFHTLYGTSNRVTGCNKITSISVTWVL